MWNWMILNSFVFTVPALAEGQEVKGFYVLQVVLKRQDYDDKNILLLQKLIPQKTAGSERFNF